MGLTPWVTARVIGLRQLGQTKTMATPRKSGTFGMRSKTQTTLSARGLVPLAKTRAKTRVRAKAKAEGKGKGGERIMRDPRLP